MLTAVRLGSDAASSNASLHTVGELDAALMTTTLVPDGARAAIHWASNCASIPTAVCAPGR